MPGRWVTATWASDPAVHAPARHRRGCTYDFHVPDLLAALNPVLDSHLAGLIADAEHEIALLNNRPDRALAPLARLLLRTESIASSKVEGLQAPVRSIAFAEAELRRLTPMLGEIVSSIDAMQLAIDDASDRSVTLAAIVDIHRALMARAHPAVAGLIREEQNWIGGNDFTPCGADFVPPPPDMVPGLLEDLVGYCGGRDASPLVQAALAHAQFETIHPFADGNGRTGRTLVHVILRRRALATHYVPPVSVVLARRRDRYIAGLTAFRAGDVGTWLETFSIAMSEATSLAQRYLGAVAAAQEEWRRHVAKTRRDSAVWDLIDVLPAHPVLNVPIAMAATRRSAPQARAAVQVLEEAGVLQAAGGAARRNRTWECSALLDLLTAVEDGTL